MRFKFIITVLFILFISGCSDAIEKKETFYKISYITYTDEEIENSSYKSRTSITSNMLASPNTQNGHVFEGWYMDESFTNKFDTLILKKDIILYAKWTKVEDPDELKALNSIQLVEETYHNLILPIDVNGFKVIWMSLNTEVFSDDGIYKFVEENTMVTFKAMIYGEDVYEREFLIMAKPYPYEEEFNKIFDDIKFPDLISSNIELQTKFDNEVKSVWESSKLEVISNSGKVTLTKNQEDVILTLTLSVYEKSRTHTYNVKTVARELNYKDPEYFINSLETKSIDTNKVIMTSDEIESFNNTVINTPNAKTVDLSTFPTTISGNSISEMINTYKNIDKYVIYNHETKLPISNFDKTSILNNRNLNQIDSIVSVNYAISTTHTVLRSYPTMNYSSSNTMDRFQETGFSAGIPMIIYHTSIDNNWYFVQMYNYYGWVPASSVGKCNREVFLSFVKPINFIVVLENLLEINNEYIRMGYKLPYKEKTQDYYTITFPTRNPDGLLNLLDITISNNTSVSDRYIPYTYSNLLIQGYKFLGISYSWGDKFYNGLDCSSTQAAIYACFGFQMGRNTSNQWATEVYGKATNMTNEKLKTYPVGTLLYTSSHVLMYIGVDSNGDCWMLHNTSTGNICKLQTLKDYGESNINHVLELHVIN